MRICDWSSDVCSSSYPGLFLRGPMVPPYEFHSSHQGRRTSAGPCRLLRLIRRDRESRPSYFRCRMWKSRFRDLPAFLETRSEEHTSELQSLMHPSYAVFCLNKT